MLYHYTYDGINNGRIHSISRVDSITAFTQFGHMGVPFFFMISGYVIFFSAINRDAPKFAISRVKRLIPAYWTAIIFTSSFAWFLGGDLMGVSPKMILANFSMMQNYMGIGNVDGVYWTLFYEIRFYFAVFLILLLGLGKQIGNFFVAWPFLIIGAQYLGIEDPYILCHPLYYYIAGGGLFALLRDRISVVSLLSLLIAFYKCLQTTSHDFSQIEYMVIVTSFFGFFALCNIPLVRNMELPFARLCGAITYPMYLIHAHFGYMMINLFSDDENKWVIYMLVCGIVTLIAWIIHHVIEMKMAGFWERVFRLWIEIPVERIRHFMVHAFFRLGSFGLKKDCSKE